MCLAVLSAIVHGVGWIVVPPPPSHPPPHEFCVLQVLYMCTHVHTWLIVGPLLGPFFRTIASPSHEKECQCLSHDVPRDGSQKELPKSFILGPLENAILNDSITV